MLKKGQLFRAIQKGGDRTYCRTTIHCLAGAEARGAPFKCMKVVAGPQGRVKGADALDSAGEERTFPIELWNFVPAK